MSAWELKNGQTMILSSRVSVRWNRARGVYYAMMTYPHTGLRSECIARGKNLRAVIREASFYC